MTGDLRHGDVTTVRVCISGRVQGVWFRGWTVQTAQAMDLRGWVRNRRDGTVEALFAGPPDSVERIVALCRDGPPHARVEHIDLTPEDGYDGEGFQALHSV